MNDTNQRKTEKEGKKQLTWRKYWQLGVMAMVVVVMVAKKSSSSSRLVIYFSVITQTFKQTHTRVHKHQRIQTDNSHRTFHSQAFPSNSPSHSQFYHFSCAAMFVSHSLRIWHTHRASGRRETEQWNVLHFGSKVDWPNQTYWSVSLFMVLLLLLHWRCLDEIFCTRLRSREKWFRNKEIWLAHCKMLQK